MLIREGKLDYEILITVGIDIAKLKCHAGKEKLIKKQKGFAHKRYLLVIFRRV